MPRTRAVAVVLALGLLGSVVVAPAAGAKGNDDGPKGAKAGAVERSGHHLDCAKVAAKVAKLEAKQARGTAGHGPAAASNSKVAEHRARIADEIARVQAACI